MRNTNKKGFTIVELVVVVAVIAILAAVLIPTFSGVIAKANMAADKKAVTEINTQLAMVEADGKPANYGEAVAKLLANGIDIADYKPLAKDYTFYYDADLNKVLYVKDHAKAEFPVAEAEAGIDVSVKDLGRWTSLSGQVAVKEYTVNNGVAAIDDGAKLVKLIQDYAEGDRTVSKITLSEDIDLKGSSANFGRIAQLVVDGNDKTIYGFQANEQAYNLENDNYGWGLFGSVKGDGTSLKISNLVIDGAVINDGIDHVGILVGNVTDGGSLEVENVTIQNSYVRGMASVGAIIGYTQDDVSLKDVTVSNVTVVGGRGVAKLIGEVRGATVTVDNVVVTNVTVSQDASYGFESNEDATVTFTEDGTEKTRPGWTNKDYWDKVTNTAKNFQ